MRRQTNCLAEDTEGQDFWKNFETGCRRGRRSLDGFDERTSTELVAGVGDATAEAGWFNSETVCGFGLEFRQNAEAAGPDTRPERLRKYPRSEWPQHFIKRSKDCTWFESPPSELGDLWGTIPPCRWPGLGLRRTFGAGKPGCGGGIFEMEASHWLTG